MIKRTIHILFLIFFLNQCGFDPIYSSKNINFNINKIETSGNLKTSKTLKKNIEYFGNKNSKNKSLNLNIFSNVSKNITSKDKKGNPNTFSLIISVKLGVQIDNGELVQKDFSQSSSYSNNSNKFDLKKYENSLTKNLTEKISKDIILYLQDFDI